MNGRTPCASEPSGGFTLIELLVALAIAAMVSLTVMYGIALTTRGVGRLTDQVDRLDERRSLEMQLRRTLGSIAAIPVFAGQVGFVGQPTSLSFLSVVEDGGPGLYRISLNYDGSRTDGPIVLTRQLATGASLAGPETAILARHVSRFALAYYGALPTSDKAAWQQRWENVSEPPRLIRLEYENDGAVRPPIVIRLRSAP